MKKVTALFLLLFVAVRLSTLTSAVTLPDVGDARIRVVGQNAENYYLNVNNSYSKCKTKAQLLAKTEKMADVFVALDADIVALCEVEDCDSILGLLAAYMNKTAGRQVYTYVKDGTSSKYTKVGFVYHKGKVEPYRSAYSASSQKIWKKRLRIQAFREIATGEMFTLSMNHFKAKVNSYDQGGEQRDTNAQDVIDRLNQTVYDPDILIMGDLNACTGESCIRLLNNAGYAEQLTRFAPAAYSYIYKSKKELIDHALANNTMEEQITGAQVYHINTSGSSNGKFSDHDTYVIGLRLNTGSHTTALTEESSETAMPLTRRIIINGRLYIEHNGHLYDLTGNQFR